MVSVKRIYFGVSALLYYWAAHSFFCYCWNQRLDDFSAQEVKFYPIVSCVAIAWFLGRRLFGGVVAKGALRLLVCVDLLTILLLFLSVQYPRTHCGSKLAACESNEKNIATSLEMYATVHHGKYPDNLNALVPLCMRSLPECPVTGRPYVYQYDPVKNDYRVYCHGGHLDYPPNHPLYIGSLGLDPGERGPYQYDSRGNPRNPNYTYDWDGDRITRANLFLDLVEGLTETLFPILLFIFGMFEREKMICSAIIGANVFGFVRVSIDSTLFGDNHPVAAGMLVLIAFALMTLLNLFMVLAPYSWFRDAAAKLPARSHAMLTRIRTAEHFSMGVSLL